MEVERSFREVYQVCFLGVVGEEYGLISGKSGAKCLCFRATGGELGAGRRPDFFSTLRLVRLRDGGSCREVPLEDRASLAFGSGRDFLRCGFGFLFNRITVGTKGGGPACRLLSYFVVGRNDGMAFLARGPGGPRCTVVGGRPSDLCTCRKLRS